MRFRYFCALPLILLGVTYAADTVTLKDGTVIQGEIVEETPETVVVKLKFGKASYARAEIKEIVKATTAASENAAELRDVVVLKNGDEYSGLIASEDHDKLDFDVLKTGKDVSKNLAVRLNFKKAEVETVKRLTDPQRAALRAYLDNAAAETRADAVAQANLDVLPMTWDTKDPKVKIKALKIELEHFTLEANTEEEFLRKAAQRLGKVFACYKQHFGVDRNQEQKVRVLIFNSMQQYYAAIGNAIQNPAFYAPQLKLISAGCDMAKYKAEIAAIRDLHGKLDKKLDEYRGQIDKVRLDIRKQVQAYYDQSKKAGLAGKALMEAVNAEQRKLQLQLGAMENEVKKVQEDIYDCNRRNDLIFNEYTKEMFSTLYHEGFHAFLDNFLFAPNLAEHVPLWLNEGLAQYFECCRVENERLILGQTDRDRMMLLRKWNKASALVPLEKLVAADSKQFLVHEMSNLENSTKNYLQSWALTHWLGEKKRLTQPNLNAYVKAVSEGKSPEEALPLLSGIPNAELQKELDKKLGYQFGAQAEQKSE